MDPFIGEIRAVSFNFAPRGWAYCNGQLLPINQNQALFSLLGTMYGGDGQVTFALPDLRSRIALGQGQGPGLPDMIVGERGGEEIHTLFIGELPRHRHRLRSTTDDATLTDPRDGGMARPMIEGNPQHMYTGSGDAMAYSPSLLEAGGGQPHANIQPYLVCNYIIAIEGIYPSRS